MVVASHAKFVVKPGAAMSFLKAFQSKARTIVAEPDCLQFVIGRQVDPEADSVYFLHNQFRTSEAFEMHSRDILDFTDPMLSEPVQLQRYECPHEPVRRLPTSGYCLNVESIVKPEYEKEYDELIKSHSANSRMEPACVQFDWGKAPPNEEGHVGYYFHEEYTSRAGFEAHIVTPHFKRFVEFNESKDPYVTPQVVDFFEIIDLSDNISLWENRTVAGPRILHSFIALLSWMNR